MRSRVKRLRSLALFALGLILLVPAPSSSQNAGAADSTKTDLPPVGRPPVTATSNLSAPSDTIKGDEFRDRHAFSLDHFFEFWPLYVLGRRGPIGASTEFSRFGIGGGRGVVYLGSVPLNDPQDDVVPMALIPTTPIGELIFGYGGDEGFTPDRANIEGGFRIVEPPSPKGKPATSIELSRGDRGLRQRRAKFSSLVGSIGIDVAYDELRNNGYSFDARGLIAGQDFGRSTTRVQSMNLRGELPTGQGYLFAFRRYTATFDGDLISFDREHRRDGHVALIEGSFGRSRLTVFERTHKVAVHERRFAIPDSATSNRTTGGYLSIPLPLPAGKSVSVGIGYEDVVSRQEMRGNVSNPRLQKGHLGLDAAATFWGGISARCDVNLTHYVDLSSGWGGRIAVGRSLGSANHAALELKRGFRMPNLKDLFLPCHATRTPGTHLEGNRYVKEETSLEGSVGLYTRYRFLKNELRATAIQIRDPILLSEEPSGTRVFLRPSSGETEELFIAEDRLTMHGEVRGIGIMLTGAVEYTPSERKRFFASVPEFRSNARLSVGRGFFKDTSEFRVSGEHQYSASRINGALQELPSYSVFNLKIDFRLLDARIYLQWLNVTNKRYLTIWPYLMTPRTFVYGIEWTLFD
ncbi:MAG: TonB-dependent receptor [Candidatus Latescibacterota bacterium]|nr:MAG: TonB-dependent receptor [Candidatus Latescibacterota bacterium]